VAEVIVERADSEKNHMGLTTWKNAPDGKILKSDVSIAKKYLKLNEMKSLDRAALLRYLADNTLLRLYNIE